MARRWTPYEQNQLRRHGIDPESVGDRLEPVEYLTGFAQFCGREFLVTPDVLIPRIETEELVVLAVSELRGRGVRALRRRRDAPLTVADVGTGCGCIGISASLALADLHLAHRLILSDISGAALRVARKNVRRLLPTARVLFLENDLLAGFPKQPLHLVVANLPYIPTSRCSSGLASSVRDFEPLVALDGGVGGVEVLNRFLKQLPDRLAPDGVAVLEIDEAHRRGIFSVPSCLNMRIRKDQFGKRRFLILRPGT